MNKHIANLDLIRAIAILMVLFYHIVQWLPDQPESLIFLTDPGEYGVQLFFALSGFLVGGLFFKEREKYGNVDVGNFILRRITRTMPPYFIVLAVSYAGVYFSSRESFDISYLSFFQNYREEMPFFMVSWSLCVEEHFYAVLPFFLIAVFALYKALGRVAVVVMVGGALVLPMVLRTVEYQEHAPFGYHYTATHFHIDAMGFGVLIAYFFTKGVLLKMGSKALFGVSLGASVLILYATNLLSHRISFCFLLLAMAVAFGLLISSSCHIRQFKLASHPVTCLIANASYAIYLTHTLVMHIGKMMLDRFLPSVELPTMALGGGLFVGTMVCGVGFHLVIEKPLMRMRDRFFPSRSKKAERSLRTAVLVAE